MTNRNADGPTISADSRQFGWALYHISRLPEATVGVPFMLAYHQGNSWRRFDLPFRIIWTSVLLPNNNPLLSSATPSYDKGPQPNPETGSLIIQINNLMSCRRYHSDARIYGAHAQTLKTRVHFPLG